MSWQDRYYNRPGVGYSRAFGRLPMWSVTTWLIVINVAVFVVDEIFKSMLGLGQPLFLWGHFSATTAIGKLQLWRFLTFQFLHANAGHLFFNMLSLYFFGPMIEEYLGRVRYLVFYLLCGIAGAGTYLLLWRVGILGPGGYPWIPLVGASAGIFGVLLAAAQVAPNTTVMLLFPPIPMRLRTLAWVLLGIAVFTVLTQGQNAGGQAAHLGGAVLGWLLIRYPWFLSVFEFPRSGGNKRWRY